MVDSTVTEASVEVVVTVPVTLVDTTVVVLQKHQDPSSDSWGAIWTLTCGISAALWP